MNPLYSAIIEGNLDTADVFLLIAVIIFAIDAVTRVKNYLPSARGALTSAGLFFGFLGFLVL